MTTSRRNLLRAAMGGAAVAATASPGNLIAAAMSPSRLIREKTIALKPIEAALTEREGGLLLRLLNNILANQLDDAADGGLSRDEGGSWLKDEDADQDWLNDKQGLIEGLEKLEKKLQNGETLTKLERHELADLLEDTMSRADSLEEANSELTDWEAAEGESLKSNTPGVTLDELRQLGSKLGLANERAFDHLDHEASEANTQQVAPQRPNFQLGSEPLTGEHSLNAPTKPLQVEVEPPTRDDNAQRALPVPSHRERIGKWLSKPGEAPDWSSEDDLSAEDFHRLSSKPFEGEDDPHEVIQNWVESSQGMNNRLRGRGDWPTNVDEDIRDVDSLMQKHAHTFDRPTTLYRVMPVLYHSKSDVTGKDLYDKGMLSTSYSPQKALSYAEDNLDGQGSLALMRIRVPAGERALIPDRHLNHLEDETMDQGEMVLPRGARLRVKAHTQSDMTRTFGSDKRRIHFLDTELIGHE